MIYSHTFYFRILSKSKISIVKKSIVINQSKKSRVYYRKFLNQINKFNILFIIAQKLKNSKKLILNIYCCHLENVLQLSRETKNVKNFIDIINEKQLLYWIEIDVSTFFVVFDDLKIDKNIDITCVTIWNEMITQFNQIKVKIYKLKKQNEQLIIEKNFIQKILFALLNISRHWKIKYQQKQHRVNQLEQLNKNFSQ